MRNATATMILDNALPHEMGEYTFAQMITPGDFQAIADETLEAFERFYSPERMTIAIGDECEVFAMITFDESGTFSVEFA